MHRFPLILALATLTLACQPKDKEPTPPNADAQAAQPETPQAPAKDAQTAQPEPPPETAPPTPPTLASQHPEGFLTDLRLPRGSASQALPEGAVALALNPTQLRYTSPDGQVIPLAAEKDRLATGSDATLEDAYGKAFHVAVLEDTLRAQKATQVVLYADASTPFGLVYDTLANAQLSGVKAPVLAIESAPLAKRDTPPVEAATLEAASVMPVPTLTLSKDRIQAADKSAAIKARMAEGKKAANTLTGGSLSLVMSNDAWNDHRLYIHPNGFTLSGHGQTEPPLERCKKGEGEPGICLLDAESPLKQYDWLALHNAIVSFEKAHQNARKLKIRVHREVPLEVVLATLELVGPRRAAEGQQAAQALDSLEALHTSIALSEPYFDALEIGPWDGKTFPKDNAMAGLGSLSAQDFGSLEGGSGLGLGMQGTTVSRGCGMPSPGGLGLPKTNSSFGAKSGKAKLKPGKAEVAGSIVGDPKVDNRIVRKVINRHKRELVYCYEQELGKDETLQGTVTVKWAIDPKGNVVTSTIDNNAMTGAGKDKVGQCLVKRIRNWRFPAPKTEGIVTVRYPFRFAKGAK